jgi:TolB-like protein
MALAVIALAAMGLAWLALRTDRAGPTAKRGATSEVIVSEPRSIAVLPFADMSEEKNQEYFADGMAQEIIDLLTEFPQLTVIGRTSSFSFKGRNEDVRVIGEKLGVRNLVEGSVRRSGDRIRVSAQLIDTASGKNLWSNTFDRNFGDVLAVQDEIAMAIARALRLAVEVDEPHERRTLRSTEAYSYYLRGIIITERWEGESARALFEHALTLDPTFAKAQEALALAIADDTSRRLLPPEEGWTKSAEAARKALELNPRSALAHALIGDERASHAYDWRGANEELDKALALQPRDPVTLAFCSTLARDLDRDDESRQLQVLALAIDPLNPSALWANAFMHYFDGDLDKAEESLRTITRISPNFMGAHRLLGTVLLQRGQPAEALAEIRAERDHSYDGLAIAYYALGRKAESDAEISQMKALVQAGKASARALAVAHAARNELDEAFEALELSIKRYEGNFPSQVKRDPRYAIFLTDPRYQRLLRMVNHPDAKQDLAGGNPPAGPSR